MPQEHARSRAEEESGRRVRSDREAAVEDTSTHRASADLAALASLEGHT